jgi:hypothetical protein
MLRNTLESLPSLLGDIRGNVAVILDDKSRDMAAFSWPKW